MTIKLFKFVTLALILFTINVGAQSDSNNIFDNDSEFMRGFETGLFLRSKGGRIEDYSCDGVK